MKAYILMVTLTACLLGCLPSLKGQTIRIHQIDVGTGDATLITVKNTTRQINILIDAGMRGAAATVLNYLKSTEGGNLGVKPYLDYVIVSHYHEDHLGGLVGTKKAPKGGCISYSGVLGTPNTPVDFFAVLDKGNDSPLPGSQVFKDYKTLARSDSSRRVTVGELSVGEAGAVDSIIPPLPVTPARKPDTLQQLALGGFIYLGKDSNNVPIRLRLLVADALLYAPDKPPLYTINIADNVDRNAPSSAANPNNWGLVWVLEYGKFRYFTGGDIGGEKTGSYIDIETPLARKLPLYYPLPQTAAGHICAFKISHHGSEHSTNDTFLTVTKPTVCAISSGSKFGHPTQDVINRMATHTWNKQGLSFDSLENYYMTELFYRRNIDTSHGLTSGNVAYIATNKYMDPALVSDSAQMANGGYLYVLKSSVPISYGNILIEVAPVNDKGIPITQKSVFSVRWRKFSSVAWNSGFVYTCHQ